MGYLEDEDKQYLEEVQAVKNWWKDSRWRYTKRPFTAEQIVAKRGNLKIEYPSNSQAKKLWGIVENNFKVCLYLSFIVFDVANAPRRTRKLASPMVVSSPQWSPRWPSTLTPSMSPAGRALPLPPLPTNPPPILQITLW
jgi:hypothetical protein